MERLYRYFTKRYIPILIIPLTLGIFGSFLLFLNQKLGAIDMIPGSDVISSIGGKIWPVSKEIREGILRLWL